MPQAAKKLKEREVSGEFVVGGRAFFNYSQNNASPDRAERRLTQEFIERLRLDAEIESDVSLLFDAALADGIKAVPAVTKEDEPEYAEAAEIAKFVSMAVEMPRPLELIVRDMAKSGFYNGVKVAEIVLKYQQDARIDGKLVLDRINPKPNTATAFVTDKYFNVIGLVGAKREGHPVVAPSSLTDEEIIPRDKFLIIQFELEDNDPRAVSQIRAAVEAHCDKKLTREQWKEWRRTSAIPKKVGVTPEKSPEVQVRDANGAIVTENGRPKTITAEKALMTAIEGLANNSALAVPFGTSVQQLEVDAKGGEAFVAHFKSCNGEIRKVILGDSLVTGEADKDARAARESSKDVSDIKKQAVRAVLANAIKRDVFRLLTVLNYGEDKAHLTPNCFLGDTEATDWAGDISAAAKVGYKIAPEHQKQLDAQFGFEPRKEVTPIETGQPNDQAPNRQQEEADEEAV